MKKKYFLLLTLLIILVVGYIVIEFTKLTVPTDDYEDKLNASKLTYECFEKIKKLKLEKGIEIDKANDINLTGMIGEDFSEITTTLGNLEAKRTSTNPNMAAVIVDMLNELGLKPGDHIAVNFSGSFPALNIATMCAVQTLELKPFVISSVGASTHGANNPELTYLDMENYLYDEGLLINKSTYFSIGGMQDIGKEMDTSIIKAICERLTGYGYKLFYDDNLIHNINTRYKLYNEHNDTKCFINVGGNDASFGDSAVMIYVNGGILTKLPQKDKSTGLVQLFLRDNKPVIHILNIKGIASKYGLPIDPSPIPEIGTGNVYYRFKYNKVLAGSILVITSMILYFIYRLKKSMH